MLINKKYVILYKLSLYSLSLLWLSQWISKHMKQNLDGFNPWSGPMCFLFGLHAAQINV